MYRSENCVKFLRESGQPEPNIDRNFTRQHEWTDCYCHRYENGHQTQVHSAANKISVFLSRTTARIPGSLVQGSKQWAVAWIKQMWIQYTPDWCIFWPPLMRRTVRAIIHLRHKESRSMYACLRQWTRPMGSKFSEIRYPYSGLDSQEPRIQSFSLRVRMANRSFDWNTSIWLD